MNKFTKIFLTPLACLLPFASWSAFEICNESAEQIQISIMYSESEKWTSEGWFQIEPDACKTPLPNINRRYYYLHATSGPVTIKPSDARFSTGCVSSKAFTLNSTDSCLAPESREVDFITIDTKNKTSTYIIKDPFSTSNQGSSHYSQSVAGIPNPLAGQSSVDFESKACKVLYQKLPRPQLRSTKIPVGHYTDIFTPPQLKSECTNIFDTGVPDPSTCTTTTDSCGDEWHGPFGTWGCIPTTSTSCTNIKACNTYANYKKSMECDVYVQLKLPNFIEKPLSDFIDESYQVIDETRASLPLTCVPPEIRENTFISSGEQMAQAVSRQVQRRIREEVEREVKQWVQDTAITTIASSIPSGGIGGAAAMATSLSTFVYRTYKAVEPVVRYVNQAKDFAEDLGFSTACGWNEWHRY